MVFCKIIFMLKNWFKGSLAYIASPMDDVPKASKKDQVYSQLKSCANLE